MSDRYKVMLEGAGLKLEREVEKEVGEQIAVLILTGKATPSPAPHVAAPVIPAASTLQPAAGGAALSVREFLNDSEAKRSPDKIAAIARYFKDHDQKELFTGDEIRKAFEDAGEPVPGNLSRDIKWTVKAGWIAPKSGAKGNYYLTNSGRDAVAKKFPKELLKKTRIEGGAKKSNKKATTP